MKRISAEWSDPFRRIIQSIPADAEPKTITLEDWVPPEGGWNGTPGSGRVVLVGDSAHAMTMYRGEAANHGIMDVECLLKAVLPALQTQTQAGAAEQMIPDACVRYTKDMVERTAPAVLKSRQACLDAHNYERINDDSPLIQRRAAIHDNKMQGNALAAA